MANLSSASRSFRVVSTLAMLSLMGGLFAAACGEDDDPVIKSTGSGGGGGAGPDGTAGLGGSDACTGEGTGTLTVTISGLSDLLEADVSVDGPSGTVKYEASKSSDVDAGDYVLEAHRITTAGAIVGKAYSPVPDYDSACVRDGKSAVLSTKYTLEPGSQKLWVLTGGDAHTAAFDAVALGASGTVTPSVEITGDVTSANAMAFDRYGNLWVADSDQLLMYERDELGRTELTEPTLKITGDAVCEPDIVPCGAAGLAFDKNGDLWVSLRSKINRLDAGDLISSGSPSPEYVLSSSDLNNPGALAFDKTGNLWVANSGDDQILEFQDEHLDSEDLDEAEVKLSGEQGPPVVIGLGFATSLAFDKDGNLWAAHFGPNVLARYTPEDQTTGGVIRPEVQFDVSVLAVLEGIAFDDAGSLWITGKAGQIASIPASQLAADGDPSAEAVVFDSDAFGSTKALAFDPPGAGTPLAR